MEVAARWRREDDEREEQERLEREKERRPSLFDDQPDVNKLREIANNEMLPPQAKKDLTSGFGILPRKSILKKTLSVPSPDGESRLRSAIDLIFRRSVTVQDVADQSNGPASPKTSNKVKFPKEKVRDMPADIQKAWEMDEMERPIDLQAANIHIDASPFQLIERTSLLKVHSLFSMLGIARAYVTRIGRLVGVVALREVCLRQFLVVL